MRIAGTAGGAMRLAGTAGAAMRLARTAGADRRAAGSTGTARPRVARAGDDPIRSTHGRSEHLPEAISHAPPPWSRGAGITICGAENRRTGTAETAETGPNPRKTGMKRWAPPAELPAAGTRAATTPTTVMIATMRRTIAVKHPSGGLAAQPATRDGRRQNARAG
jgi:hypothetical protein